MRNNIGLQLPVRVKPSKNSFDTRLKSVEQWIESLPRASVGNCAKQIYHAVYELNHLDIRFQDRVRVMEEFREPVQYITQSMQRHFVGMAVPLADKNQKIADATREMYYLMAVGYQIALEDMLAGKHLLLDKKKLTTLIHRAISYLSRVLLTTFQNYAPLPKNIWFNINKLYACAEAKKLHHMAVMDSQHQYIQKTTIEDEYVRILLLSLASPYHLHHGEIGKVYINLERWKGYAMLHGVSDEGRTTGDFMVNLESDSAPGYLALNTDKIDVHNVRTLDTFSLVETLYAELQKSEEILSKTLININLGKETLSHDLIHRLGASWGAIAKRAHERISRTGKINLTVGLSATHQAILNYSQIHAGFNEKVAEDDSQILRVVETQSRYQIREVEHAADEKPDIWEMVYTQGKLQLVSSQAGPDLVKGNAESRKDMYCTLKDWTLVNQSEDGYCIHCDADCGNSVQVGEIIGLQPVRVGPTAQWTIGIIRWVQNEGKHSVRVGGQFLSRTAIPVGISTTIESAGDQQIQRALLLPSVKAMGRPSRLITTGGTFRVGVIVKIYLETGTINAKLTNECLKAGLYLEFEYEEISDNTPGIGSADGGDASEVFEDIWSSI